MTPTRTLMMSSALALVTALPAYADLTAEQVLADQLRQMSEYGLNVTVSGQSRSGDTLVVDGLSTMAEMPDASFTITMAGATFRELDDGTVEVTYPEDFPVTMSGTSEDGEDFEMQISMTQTNTRLVASGIPEEITYDFTSDSFSIDDIAFTAPEEAAELDMDVSVQMNGLTGTMSYVGGGTVRDYSAAFQVDSVRATITGAPEDEGTFDFALEASDIDADYSGRAAPQDLMGSIAQAVEAGNTTSGTATHGPVTYTIAGDGPDGTFELATAVASGAFDFSMDADGLEYETLSTDMTVSVGGSVIPLPPLTFKMAENVMRFAMPVVPSEDRQDFGLRLSLAGLEVDPMLWGMIDPAGQIPRDPANLVVDLGGEVTMTEDIFAPEFAEEMTEAPGEFHSLTVNEILLSLAGAELTGDGAFTFEEAEPMPTPVGTMNFMLKGGNTLLDTLVNMGLVPEDQAMGARMMIGLFAKPGDGPDTLTSTIELQEGGAVLANGQRIR